MGYGGDALTEAMVWYLAATQRPDGSWPAADYRPPMEEGPVQGAAFAIQALRLYPLAGRESELKQRIGRARDYLAKARPTTFNQQVFQLLGLGWAGESSKALGPFVKPGAPEASPRADLRQQGLRLQPLASMDHAASNRRAASLRTGLPKDLKPHQEPARSQSATPLGSAQVELSFSHPRQARDEFQSPSAGD